MAWLDPVVQALHVTLLFVETHTLLYETVCADFNSNSSNCGWTLSGHAHWFSRVPQLGAGDGVLFEHLNLDLNVLAVQMSSSTGNG